MTDAREVLTDALGRYAGLVETGADSGPDLADLALRALDAAGYEIIPRREDTPVAYTYDPDEVARFHLKRDTLAGYGEL